jgi:hypothetical protein
VLPREGTAETIRVFSATGKNRGEGEGGNVVNFNLQSIGYWALTCVVDTVVASVVASVVDTVVASVVDRQCSRQLTEI